MALGTTILGASGYSGQETLDRVLEAGYTDALHASSPEYAATHGSVGP